MTNHVHDAFLNDAENPYEMVVLAALEAGRINAARLAPPDRKPTSIAIERVARGEITHTVEDGAAESPSSSAATGENEPTRAA